MSVDNKESEWDEEHALDSVLNNMIDELRKVRVRFPNEPTYDIIENFDIDSFELEKEFDFDVYGKYRNSYVMINKEDYNNII